MKVTRIIAAAAMTAALAGTAHAQVTVNCTGTPTTGPSGCLVTNTVSASVPIVARLVLSAAATTLTSPTAADFGTTAGVSDGNAVTLTVRANAAYRITASTAATSWTGPTGTTKPVGDLRLSTDNFGTTSVLTGAGVQIASGAAPTAGANIQIGYNVRYDWTTDLPGGYSLPVRYTLTSP
jgi:hypothetical protein